MKNTSIDCKDTALISVLQGHFKGKLNLARGKFICLFIRVLVKVRSVNHDKLLLDLTQMLIKAVIIEGLLRQFAIARVNDLW